MVATAPNQQAQAAGRRQTRPALIDSDADLYPYLSARWLEHVKSFGLRGAAGGFYPRFMDHREDARPPSGRRSGSEVSFTRSHYMDPFNVAYGILIPLSPTSGQQNLELSAALATACNDWQVAEWLDPEPRLRATMAIPVEAPD